ncbi:lipoprotein, putative [Rhodobacteraceae bacterium KLH11]|nr:lipoprotein, putative [Rhodobacteraceae bacterium KLH11]
MTRRDGNDLVIRLFSLLPVLALIVACTSQEAPPASRSAQFPGYPQNLFNSFKTDCAGPGDKYVKTGTGTFECRETLSPEATAYLILSFDGYPQNLPQIVTRLSSTKNQSGYRVDAELFFLVPQKSGKTLRIPIESADLDRDFSRLYSNYGGTPV